MKSKSFLVFCIISFMFVTKGSAQTSHWIMTGTTGKNYLLTTELQKDHFKAYSRQNALKQILGFKYTLGKLTGKIKKAQFFNIEGKAEYSKDTVRISGKYISLWSKQHFTGIIVNDSIYCKIFKNPKKKYAFSGKKTDGIKPLKDYASIIEQAFELTEQNLYDPKLSDHKDWKRFKEKVKKLKGHIYDDYELETAYNQYLGDLPFTHYYLMRETSYSSDNSNTSSYIDFKEISKRTAYMNVKSFSGSKAGTDSIISLVRKGDYENLIIDLRKNPGGSIEAALPLAEFLISEEMYGGLFLTRKWFEKHENPPKTDEFGSFTLFSEADFELIIEGIHHEQGLCLKIFPAEKQFEGKVYILTSSYTASTCEPFVYCLKDAGLVTVVGEKTAGAMLNGEKFNIGDDFILWMPTAEYYTPDGKRIDRVGVSPNIQVKSSKAYDYVLKELRE